MNIITKLRCMGLDDRQIALTTEHGKSLSEVETEKKKVSQGDHFKSKTERYYSWFLDDQKKADNIVRWEYETMKFCLAPSDKGRGAWYTPDFFVWHHDGRLEIIEIKGFLREAARVRFLVAKDRYPEFKWRMIRRTKNGVWIDIL